jgi:HTH-type transcriptional regulator/antitoxin HipB
MLACSHSKGLLKLIGARASGATIIRMKPREAVANRLALAVRQRRKLLGITQQALAKMAGCGLVFVYNLEHGKPSLRFDKLLDVLSVLGLEVVVSSGDSGLRVAAAEAARDA